MDDPVKPAPERLRHAAERARRQAKITLLHARYVVGYLAAGFGVSAPVTLGYQIYYGQDSTEMMALSGLSLGYGILFLIPFVLLEPMTRIAWERMRVPEFRMFELSVSRSAALVSLGMFALSLLRFGPWTLRMSRWLPPGLFWTVFILMGTAWGKIKAHTILFPEFYADRGGERVLEAHLHPPVREGAPVKDTSPVREVALVWEAAPVGEVAPVLEPGPPAKLPPADGK